MTLAQIIHLIERIAGSQPTVGSIVREDVRLLSEHPDVQYTAFAWTQGVHRADGDGGWTAWQFYLFAADRVRKDGDLSNELEVQSAAAQLLGNVIRELRAAGSLRVQAYTLHPFRERFADECAGMYADVTIQAPGAGDCYDDFEGYFSGLEPRAFQLIDAGGARPANTEKLI